MAETTSAPSLREQIALLIPGSRMEDVLAVADSLIEGPLAGRLIDPTTQTEAVASARAEGVREGLERAAEHFDQEAEFARQRLLEAKGYQHKLHPHRAMREAERAASDIRAMIPTPPILTPRR